MTFVPAQGFADPVADANQAFRAVLDAMAHPGRLYSLPPCPQAPKSLGAELGAILLALADRDTPLWLDGGLNDPDVLSWLGFHTGVVATTAKEEASFAAFSNPKHAEALDVFPMGTPEYPDRSATLLIKVDELREGGGLHLSGPGVKSVNRFTIGGVEAAFWQARSALAPLYPLGLDMIFCANGQIAALPRTTLVEA